MKKESVKILILSVIVIILICINFVYAQNENYFITKGDSTFENNKISFDINKPQYIKKNIDNIEYTNQTENYYLTDGKNYRKLSKEDLTKISNGDTGFLKLEEKSFKNTKVFSVIGL